MKSMQTKWENVNFLQEGDAPNKFKKKVQIEISISTEIQSSFRKHKYLPLAVYPTLHNNCNYKNWDFTLKMPTFTVFTIANRRCNLKKIWGKIIAL